MRRRGKRRERVRELAFASRSVAEQHRREGPEFLRVAAKQEVVGQVLRDEPREKRDADHADEAQRVVARTRESDIARGERREERRECEHADDAGLQPLARDDVVRMSEQRIAGLGRQLRGEDAPAEAIAEERPRLDARRDALP